MTKPAMTCSSVVLDSEPMSVSQGSCCSTVNAEDTASVVPESPPPASPALTGSRSPPKTVATPTSAGAPLCELSFGPSAYPVLPPLRSSLTHCVMFNTAMKPGVPPEPYPAVFKDVWDSNHVRMPCSSQSLYPVEGGKGEEPNLVPKWDLVKKAFQSHIAGPGDLEKAILSYNTRFAGKWSFQALHHYFTEYADSSMTEQFFGYTLPKIIELALSLPKVVTHGLPLLKKQESYSITLSQHQAACLLANAFLCTFPRRNSGGPGSEYRYYPGINFNQLLSGNPNTKLMHKLKCIFHYLEVVTDSLPIGTLTFTRQVCSVLPQWEKLVRPCTKLYATSRGLIEDDGHGMLQADFANKFIGGGVLRQGCVQEEIRFMVCPEMILSLLFTEELCENEALIMTGAERFSYYSGYANTFKWQGGYNDSTLADSWRRKTTQVVAIDAIPFRNQWAQFQPDLLRRELNKAYAGFMTSEKSSSGKNAAVATGKWGCGAFRGDPHLKTVIQWMAASAAGRDMVMFTFDSKELVADIGRLYHWVVSNHVTVSQLWTLLVNYYKQVVQKKGRAKGRTPLFDFMLNYSE